MRHVLREHSNLPTYCENVHSVAQPLILGESREFRKLRSVVDWYRYALVLSGLATFRVLATRSQFVASSHTEYMEWKNLRNCKRGGNVIARVWRGWTKTEDADGYEGHLKPELLPGLSKVAGFRGSYLGGKW
jgi:hypothetical protein